MGKDVIVACDFSSAEATFAFLDKFANCARKPFLKIGMELYYAEGPSIVREIKARGHKIFLDLKLHDIPNTVKKAMSVLRNLDVDITNLHAAGATAMMKGALEGLTRPDGTRPLLIAVTQLTSTDQETMERDLLINHPIDEVVMHYAETAKNAGDAQIDDYAKKRHISREEVMPRFIKNTPLGRLCELEDVTNLVVFLASDRSSYMTGQSLNLTGGGCMD